MHAFATMAGRMAGKSSLYLLGAASGFAVAIPLTAAAVGAGASAWSNPIVAGLHGPAAVLQAPMVNRAAKGPRLDIRIPSAPGGSSMVARSELAAGVVQTSGPAPMAGATADATGQPVPRPRAMQAPRGCLSSIGVTRSNLVTDETVVCVADASIINSIQ
ncbi:hypothetical protein [Ancylobacter amanitiformis]|uniref:Uncharacterized protein n=1 Tax=Ancylobacter amanitiformis TaxID=217069 RepID=A0ABU0LT99_9HYPH|nr:hypothetical protein [Ancylobacter amanitiformis]MDQ0511942.1 hypothetical protein [Ancylobacter amanitiformis]